MQIKKIALLSLLALSSAACTTQSLKTPHNASVQTAETPAPALLVRFALVDTVKHLPMLRASMRAAYSGRVRSLRFDREGPQLTGILAFESIQEFEEWGASGFEEFIAPFGPDASLRSLRFVRPNHSVIGDNDALAALAERIQVSYRNTGNEAEGDADIDAVTVICGDGATCKPSN